MIPEVEDGEELCQLAFLLWHNELVSSKGGHTWLDASRPYCY